MGGSVLRIKILFGYIIYSVLLLYYVRSKNRYLIDADMERWEKEIEVNFKTKTMLLIFLLMFRPQFRNLFYFRCPEILNVFRKICLAEKNLSIATDDNNIEGGGVFLEHAFSTIIAAKSIGEGCTFRQLTTIGVKSRNRHDEKPVIGRNVDFGANVTCIGNITIGDNAIIAAGSVVVKDVPENAVVAGNPAKIIKFRNNKTIN